MGTFRVSARASVGGTAVAGSGVATTVPALATRAVNSFTIQLVKIGAYFAFGVLHWRLARYGLVAGAGAVAAIWLANPWLRRLSSFRFRQLSVVVMLAGGLLLLWQQRVMLLALIGV